MNILSVPNSPPGRTRTERLLSAVLLAVLCLAMAGCATVGRDFPMDRVADIHVGETTQARILEIFGPPWRVGQEDGNTTWTYGKYRYRLLGRPSTSDLVVRFSNGGLVKSYSFSTTEHAEGKTD